MLHLDVLVRCASAALAIALGPVLLGCPNELPVPFGPAPLPVRDAPAVEPTGPEGEPGPLPPAADASCAVRGASYVGSSPLRLMTRVEYDNTVRDLFGEEGAPAHAAFPIENETLGFENGEAHAANPQLVDAYVEVSELVARGAFERGLLDELDCVANIQGEIHCGEEFISWMGRRVFRRPLTFAEFDLFHALLLSSLPEFGYEDTLQMVLQAMLQSPQFLYRLEFGDETPARATDDGTAAPLTSWEMASRLSFFLWNSTPDDRLLNAAQSDALRTPEQIEQQVRRMLDDERAQAMVWDFHRQWLDLDRLDGITKDMEQNPEWDPAMAAYWKTELRRFIEHTTLEEGGSLQALLTSRTTYVNPTLAAFYDVPPPEAHGFAPVELNGRERAGLLTQPGLLALLALPDQSSPILRGLFVRRDLLCQPLDPPPPDIVVVPPDPDPTATTRERFAEHTSNETCQGCHLLIDPLGFGFENYDAIGRFRAEENGLPVDASGEVAWSGDPALDGPFDGAVALAERMAESSVVRDCLATHWFRYAIGRKEMMADGRCNLGFPRERFEASGGDFKELIVALALTDAFRLKRLPAPVVEEAP